VGGLRQASLRGPAHVLEYLGRYTHRVAISNQRLLASMMAKSPSPGPTTATPPQGDDRAGQEFIRLFLQHACPLLPAHSLLRLPGQLSSRRSARTLSKPAGHPLWICCLDLPTTLIFAQLRLCPSADRTMVQLQVLFPCHAPYQCRWIPHEDAPSELATLERCGSGRVPQRCPRIAWPVRCARRIAPILRPPVTISTLATSCCCQATPRSVLRTKPHPPGTRTNPLKSRPHVAV